MKGVRLEARLRARRRRLRRASDALFALAPVFAVVALFGLSLGVVRLLEAPPAQGRGGPPVRAHGQPLIDSLPDVAAPPIGPASEPGQQAIRAVPEPDTGTLLGTGLALLVYARRLQRVPT